ncbi:MAG: glycoside hydrolase family 172 protein [Candidatus Hydrogenedentota bacterium]
MSNQFRATACALIVCSIAQTQVLSMESSPFNLDLGVKSRSISFESPTGAVGAGGQAASPLGVGRKGSPARMIAAGQEIQLCDVEGAGTIRHIWMTTFNAPLLLRGAVIRMWWEGQDHPSVEAPIGDFFGFAHGKVMAYESAVHSVGQNAALNFWLPMPFTKRARITFKNEGKIPMPLFYQIDYTVDDKHPNDVGRMHAVFLRQNPTTAKQDFELLPKRIGKGRLIGSVIGVRVEDEKWWGEGEVKMYLDGDKEFATIVGTGSEDYVGLSFGMQQTPFRYHGCSLNEKGFISMYRWHLPDPVFWEKDARVTIQQIGHLGTSTNAGDYMGQLYERQDDWSAATFWYEPAPSAPLPAMPPLEQRIANLWK